jgi:hypothetical protein
MSGGAGGKGTTIVHQGLWAVMINNPNYGKMAADSIAQDVVAEPRLDVPAPPEAPAKETLSVGTSEAAQALPAMSEFIPGFDFAPTIGLHSRGRQSIRDGCGGLCIDRPDGIARMGASGRPSSAESCRRGPRC